MTKRELLKTAAVYIDKLRMTDWKFDIDWMTHAEISEGEDADESTVQMGWSWWEPAEKFAFVRIAPPKYHKAVEKSVESTVLHEILHVFLEGHQNIPQNNLHFERVINRLTELLLE